MFDRTLSAAEIERIRREREQADARYNDALTLLDRATLRAAAVPAAPPPLDEAKLPSINESWQILGSRRAEFGSGWRGRLAAFVWRLVGPPLQQQEHFNATLVDHLNRNVEGERRTREALGHALTLLGEKLAALATFESLLIQFLQQITAYVDTKDRDLAAAILRDPHQQLGVIEKSIALIQQQQLTLKRELAGIAGPSEARPTQPAAARPSVQAARSDSLTLTLPPFSRGEGRAAALDTATYLCFEREFRGDEDAIRRRFEAYVPYFQGASDVLDVGCGRGEFLELLRDAGISARGIDLNGDMVDTCRTRGLDVAEADAVAYLERSDKGSLGGLFAAQVVEHFETPYLVRFLELAYETLRPGSKVVLETINVDCWSAFFGPYLRDLTHIHPLPSETLRFLLQASGFQRLQVIARSPVEEPIRLRRIGPDAAGALNPEIVAALNTNTDRLNSLLFTHLDYAVVGERL